MVLVVRFCKKPLKIALSVIIVLATIYCVVLSIDINRVESFREPIFNIGHYEESGLIEYKGLGYRTVVKYGYTNDNEQKINSIEMYMFDKYIAGSIEQIDLQCVLIGARCFSTLLLLLPLGIHRKCIKSQICIPILISDRD